jgi:hypothetical protein
MTGTKPFKPWWDFNGNFGLVAVLDPGNHKSKLASVLPHAYQLPRLHLLEGTQR